MSAPAAPAQTSAAPAAASAAAMSDLPNERVLLHAAKFAMEKDKPILLDYYKDSRTGAAFMGQDKDTGEKFLVKGPEEYTSPIQHRFKVKEDFIIETENSIYIVSALMKGKMISSAGM